MRAVAAPGVMVVFGGGSRRCLAAAALLLTAHAVDACTQGARRAIFGCCTCVYDVKLICICICICSLISLCLLADTPMGSYSVFAGLGFTLSYLWLLRCARIGAII